MQVEVIKYNQKSQTWQPAHQMSDIDSHVGTLVEYTNGITGKPDPQIVFAPGRWVHLSTLQAQGNRVRSVETGEIVVIADLSPNGYGMVVS